MPEPEPHEAVAIDEEDLPAVTDEDVDEATPLAEAFGGTDAYRSGVAAAVEAELAQDAG